MSNNAAPYIGAGAALATALTKQPSTSGGGTGGAQNFAAAGGGLDAGELFGGAKLAGSASASSSGGGGGGGGGGSGSGAVADQRQILASLKSDNKNKLGANLDYSGNAGQRGASFNFGTNVSPTIGAGGGSLMWIAIAVVGVVVLGGLYLWRRK